MATTFGSIGHWTCVDELLITEQRIELFVEMRTLNLECNCKGLLKLGTLEPPKSAPSLSVHFVEPGKRLKLNDMTERKQCQAQEGKFILQCSVNSEPIATITCNALPQL